ncbi:hypothetical protein PBI_CHE12_94 [Mycobacterium phage Che12]|uniref:Uncharacterized protein n=1 Tax=Mycobacterium phage Che12 TaxID=2911435 RepID=Q1A0C3_9CAUD|nr:gp94 [Mycobacterium phage Che12]ABE67413.1 hypothetical protein PBI_CHE12_94 [Mycobacterium phage Che12]
MTEELINALFENIVAEHAKRYQANIAEPYNHSVYQFHADRIDRLIAALADGNEALRDGFYEALFDIYDEGVDWVKKVFADISRDIAEG